MKTVRLTQTYKLRAMHRLPDCVSIHGKSLHGHDYKIEVTCSGEIDSHTGLLIHRDKMNAIVNDVLIKKYDKTYLNCYFEVSSGEVLCYTFFNELYQTELAPFLHEVKIQETHKNSFSFKNCDGSSFCAFKSKKIEEKPKMSQDHKHCSQKF